MQIEFQSKLDQSLDWLSSRLDGKLALAKYAEFFLHKIQFALQTIVVQTIA